MVKRLQKKERLISSLHDVLLFLVVFNLLAIPLYIAIYTDFSFKPLQDLNAKLLYSTLKFFGYTVDIDSFVVNLISDEMPQKIEISWDSTGWKSMYAVAALIIATPIATISKRMKFVALGVIVIFVLNYLRIATTILVSTNFGFHLFDIVHTVLWREGLILGVVGFWFIWLRKEKYNIG